MKKKSADSRIEQAKKNEAREPGDAPAEVAAVEVAQSNQDLQSSIREKEKAAAENYEKYLRAVADLENYKKLAARERSDLIKYNNERMIKDILPILDNLERALEQGGTSKDLDAFMSGVKMIQEQLLACLERYGVKRIESVGREFNPNMHEALLQVESAEHENNLVVTEFEKGYLLNDRLLKPAKVSVSKRTSGQQESEKGND